MKTKVIIGGIVSGLIFAILNYAFEHYKQGGDFLLWRFMFHWIFFGGGMIFMQKYFEEPKEE